MKNTTTNQSTEKRDKYSIINLATGETIMSVMSMSLAGAQEYFDIMIPNMGRNHLLVQVKA